MLRKFRCSRFLSATADGGGEAAQSEEQGSDVQTSDEQPAEGTKNSAEGEASGNASEMQGDALKLTAKVDVEEISERVRTAIAEEMKKAAMNEDERGKYELEQKEQLLDEREKALSARELKANTIRLLAEKGFPPDIADAVMGADMKQTAQNLKRFTDCLDKEVQRQVTDRLKGKTPGSGNVGTSVTDSVKAQFLSGLNGV